MASSPRPSPPEEERGTAAVNTPSPPLEERAGERRPFTRKARILVRSTASQLSARLSHVQKVRCAPLNRHFGLRSLLVQTQPANCSGHAHAVLCAVPKADRSPAEGL